MEFSEDIKQLLKDKFPDKDMYSMSKDELIQFREEVVELREEYNLLEMAMKGLGNAAYGAAANQYFYFFNVELAGDITGECRNLTKSMIRNLENFFHEEIWTRKDLQEKFDFELDESMHDWYREQPIWVYSDTDSAYTTYGSLFKCMTPKYKEKYSTDKAKLDFILKFNKEFLDDQNSKWCQEIYDKRFGNSVHEFELETVSRSGIFLKKKMNMKALAYSKGKYFDDYKISGTGIELIKTTTPSLCRKIIKDITMSLMYDYDEDNKVEYIQKLNAKLKQYKREFWCADAEDISQSIGVGSYKTYVLNDEDELTFALKAPVSVKSVGWFNYLAHKNNDDNKKFYSGKIKYYRFLNGNNKEYFGYPAGELPSWAPPMDKNEQWQKTVISPINRFLEVMKIPIKSGEDNIQLGLFDFA